MKRAIHYEMPSALNPQARIGGRGGKWSDLVSLLVGAAVTAVGMLCSMSAFADDMPFWGEGSPSTNRETVVCQTNAVVQNFSSFMFSSRRFAMSQFDSRKNGAIVIFY